MHKVSQKTDLGKKDKKEVRDLKDQTENGVKDTKTPPGSPSSDDETQSLEKETQNLFFLMYAIGLLPCNPYDPSFVL